MKLEVTKTQEETGLGLYLSTHPSGRGVQVSGIEPGSSAHKASAAGQLRAGDVIYSIDGKDVRGRSVRDILRRFEGAIGDTFDIGVRPLPPALPPKTVVATVHGAEQDSALPPVSVRANRSATQLATVKQHCDL